MRNSRVDIGAGACPFIAAVAAVTVALAVLAGLAFIAAVACDAALAPFSSTVRMPFSGVDFVDVELRF